MKKTGLAFGIVVTALTVSLLSGCNSAPQKPAEEVLRDGVANLAQVTSATYDVSLKGDIKDPSSTDVTFDLGASGLFDVKDMKLPKLAIKLIGSASDKSGMDGKVGAELRLDKDMAYFNIMNVDSKALPLPADVKALMNKWWSSKVPQDVMDQLKTSTTTSAVGGTQESKFKSLLVGVNLFTKPTLVGTESVGGESSWHYQTSIDNAGLVALMKKVSEEEGTTVSADELAKMNKQFEKIKISGDVWIAIQSGIMNKFEGTFTMTGAAGEPSGTVNVKMELGGINQAVKIEVPAPVEEFTMDKATPIMMMLQGGAPTDSSLGGAVSGELSGETQSPGLELATQAAVQ
jgi:hypothetical protein